MDIADSVGSQEVVADKEKIARVVFNLLSNALKYTPAGGDIFVSLKDEDGKFRLDVRDTGKGISQEEAGKIFERFFQAKGAASGTGIGLALVKSFVELHHGEACVESELGKGSDFFVVIPREQEDKSLVIHTDVDNVDNSVNASLSECKTLINESELQYIDDGERKSGKVSRASLTARAPASESRNCWRTGTQVGVISKLNRRFLPGSLSQVCVPCPLPAV